MNKRFLNFFHLSDHINLCFFRKEAILLDLKEDKYHILKEELAQLLLKLLNEPWEHICPLYTSPSTSIQASTLEDTNRVIKQFKHLGILKEGTFNEPYPYKIDKKDSSSGVFSAAWRLPLNKETFPLSYKTIVEAIWMLFRVNFILKRKKFYGLIRLIQGHLNKTPVSIIPSPKEIQGLITCLNHACLVYPKTTKCLEWAAAWTLLALRRGWKCNLVIGVQNYPFIAHAWAEVNGEIIGDTEEFPNNLAIILKEPFRERVKL